MTHLERQSGRTTALHRLVLEELSRRDGEVLWLDAVADAPTVDLYDQATRKQRRALNDWTGAHLRDGSRQTDD